MQKSINVLILENEPLVIYAMEKAFEVLTNSQLHHSFNIKIVRNCESASMEIDRAKHNSVFDLALLNIDMSPSETQNILFIDDLVLKLKTLFPELKIIALTSNNDKFRINNIIQILNPESFLLKGDLDIDELIKAINMVLLESPYYSKVILRLIRRLITNNFNLDKLDKLILYHLSKGVKTKDLPDFVHLSISAIERRKRLLKDIFNVENCNDQLLLKEAKDKGFI